MFRRAGPLEFENPFGCYVFAKIQTVLQSINNGSGTEAITNHAAELDRATPNPLLAYPSLSTYRYAEKCDPLGRH